MKGGRTREKTADELFDEKLHAVIRDINKIKSDFYESFNNKDLIDIESYNAMVDRIDSELNKYTEPLSELVVFIHINYDHMTHVKDKRDFIDTLKIKCRNKIMDFLDEALNDNINGMLLERKHKIEHNIEEYKNVLTKKINSVSKNGLDRLDTLSSESYNVLISQIRGITDWYRSVYPESEQTAQQFKSWLTTVDDLFDELSNTHESIGNLIDTKKASYVNSNKKVKSRKRLVNKTRKRN